MSDQEEVKEKIVYIERPAKKGKGLWWKVPLGLVVLFVIIGVASSGNKPPTDTSLVPKSDQTAKEDKTEEPKKDLAYKQVTEFKGNGAKKSEPFEIKGDKFKIKYDCKGSFCGATLKSPTDQFKMDLIMNQAGNIKDETILYGAGVYYIDANTIGTYTITVEDFI